MSTSDQLRALNFHDATLVSVRLLFGEDSGRSASVELDYYDCEGNEKRREEQPQVSWLTKRLSISFGFLVHIEFSGPDLVNRAQDIDFAEIGYDLATFEHRHANFKRQFPNGSYPLFEGSGEVVSLRLTTQNNDEELNGYLWIVGNEVELTWSQSTASQRQTHVPLRDA
jgi:hypothetical protein